MATTRKVLVPVDGSDNAMRALRHVLSERDNYKLPLEVLLINVQPPIISGNARMFLTQDQLNNYYHEEGEAAISAARDLLSGSGVPYEHKILVGDVAETIAKIAREKSCSEVVMGTRGLGAISGMLLGSVATKVIHLSEVPVRLVK